MGRLALDAPDAYGEGMASNEKARPLSQVVGERVRQFREARGVRQEDVADEARKYGFPWGRSSVAALEAGNRDLSFAELLILPSLLKRLGGWDEPLLPPGVNVILNENLWMPASQIPSHVFALMTPSVRSERLPAEDEDFILGGLENEPPRKSLKTRQSIARTVQVYDYLLLVLWPGRGGLHLTPEFTRGVEIARKIAERVKTPDGKSPDWQLIQIFSWGLWGRNPGDERDARAASRGTYETKRALQSARGHVTRELIEELQAEIDKKWPTVKRVFDEMESAIATEEGLNEWEERLRKLEHPELYADAFQDDPEPKRGFLRGRRRP